MTLGQALLAASVVTAIGRGSEAILWVIVVRRRTRAGDEMAAIKARHKRRPR